MTAPRTEIFDHLPDGREVSRITLSNGLLTVRVLTLGAILQDVRLKGVPWPLTLGTDSAAPYTGDMGYYGALVGPVANRIGGAATEIDGTTYTLEPNAAGGHFLHSGSAGLHTRLWSVLEAQPTDLTLSTTLPDGACGLPGQREIVARFRLDGPTLTLTVTATTDARTPMNIANHSYWNLDGGGSTASHRLRIAAAEVLEADAAVLPTGHALPVEGTHFDFRSARHLPAARHSRIDHNYCLARARRAPAFAAELTGASGVRMTIETTEPGLQVYDGESIDVPGRDGTRLGPFEGVALEAQGWPDAPNRPDFPSVMLDPGEVYRQVTRWRFAAP